MQTSTIVAVCGGTTVAIIAIMAAVMLPKRAPPITPERPAQVASAEPPVPPQAPVRDPREATILADAEKLRASLTLGDAMRVAKPYMTDKFGESSLGTTMISVWGVQMLSWSEVAVAKDETSYALVMKDADAERGKRLCISGPIIEISKDGVDNLRYFSGLMESAREDLFHFHAVKSTGNIVQGHRAKFCGVVTGEFSYRNSGGGTGHAVDVVGMFDLPENKM